MLSFQSSVLLFFRWTPRSGIAGSYGSSIFNFLRKLHTVFHSDCTNFHSHRQCMGVPFFQHPHQNLLFIVFLVITILTGVRWYVTVVLIFISLMAGDIEHLFMSCWSSVCLLEKCFFKSSANFLTTLFAFLLLSCMSSSYILDINPLLDISFANIFSHSVGGLFVLLTTF